MNFFINFLNKKEHLYYVSSSYLIVFFLLVLIFLVTLFKVNKLERKLNKKLKYETKK
ncbi:MAG: heme exporter protein CcmD [Alphaproteobacteria bacterium]